MGSVTDGRGCVRCYFTTSSVIRCCRDYSLLVNGRGTRLAFRGFLFRRIAKSFIRYVGARALRGCPFSRSLEVCRKIFFGHFCHRTRGVLCAGEVIAVHREGHASDMAEGILQGSEGRVTGKLLSGRLLIR